LPKVRRSPRSCGCSIRTRSQVGFSNTKAGHLQPSNASCTIASTSATGYGIQPKRGGTRKRDAAAVFQSPSRLGLCTKTSPYALFLRSFGTTRKNALCKSAKPGQEDLANAALKGNKEGASLTTPRIFCPA